MTVPQRQTRFRVEGMDCASCATKIDTAVRRIPTVIDVSVSVVAGTMTVSHDPEIDLDSVARKLGSLGYTAAPLARAGEGPTSSGKLADHAGHVRGHVCGHDRHDHSRRHRPGNARSSMTSSDVLCGMHGQDHDPIDGPWWSTSKARLTIG